MNLIMINDKILNLDHVVEIHFTDKVITIEKAVSRMVYGLGGVNTGNSLSAKSFQELREILESRCEAIIGNQKEKSEMKMNGFKNLPKDPYQQAQSNIMFNKPPDSVLNRANVSDDEVIKKDPEVIEIIDKVIKKSRNKKEKKDAK